MKMRDEGEAGFGIAREDYPNAYANARTLATICLRIRHWGAGFFGHGRRGERERINAVI
jgi:hypothetical protein